MYTGSTVKLGKGSWTVGTKLGKGGFGEVYEATQGANLRAVKFVPKYHGAARELLLELPDGARNVVPIVDDGEDEDNWILLMPRATCSLEAKLDEVEGPLPLSLALEILKDVAESLSSLDGSIVHRDIKPGNILLLDGKWCLSDFGISRYADADTATHTHKDKGSTPYTAPERFYGERATHASDMYSFGIVAYELLTGSRPFTGTRQDIIQGHLDDEPPRTELPEHLDWLIRDCLAKVPAIRPTAAQFQDRLQRIATSKSLGVATALERANQEQIRRQEAAELQARQLFNAAAERQARVDFAREKLGRISKQLAVSLQEQAPSATFTEKPNGGWGLQLGAGTIVFSEMYDDSDQFIMREDDDPFTVLASGSIALKQWSGLDGYVGRSHSLWYADVQREGDFQWFETAFFQNLGWAPTDRLIPFAAAFETPEAMSALRDPGEYLVAWPFTAIEPDDMSEFIDRWADWLALASGGQLAKEVDIEGAQNSWRTA